MTTATVDTQISNYSSNSVLIADEVAAYLKISRSKAYNIMNSDVMNSFHMGRSVRVRFKDLLAYIESVMD